jgi:double-stranded uracil-DNA glycosylase
MKCSFPPVIAGHSRILILGSLPGEQSLRRQQYYANPRNQFWRVLSAVFNEPVGEPYEEKLAFVLRHGLALWDTVQCAERQGSLDQHIQNAIANDFPALFAGYPNLHAVAFNGGKSAELFRRLVQKQLEPALLERLKLLPLPSTSPTNLAPLQSKIAKWQALAEMV